MAQIYKILQIIKPIEFFYHLTMSATKIPRGVGMKYTRYLVYGNVFYYNRYETDIKIVRFLVSTFELIRTFYLLGFGFLLLPFALTLDTGRLFLYLEIRIKRKLKQISLIYKFRKNTINLVYRGGKLAYLLIQKTESFIIKN